jgi:hypothetical protein
MRRNGNEALDARKLIEEAHLVLTVGIETRSLKLVRAERSVWIDINGVDTRHSWGSRPLDKAPPDAA